MSERATLLYKGCNLHYRLHGAGIPVLMIQGVGVHGDGWLPHVGLSHACECLTFDNRGMGKTQPCNGALAVEQMADDALALMDTVGWESAHVMGHSLGGLVATHLALVARQRVKSLSLLCTFARGKDVTRPSPRMIWIGTRMHVGPRAWRRRAFLELILSRTARMRDDLDEWAAKLAPIFGHDLADSPPIVNAQLKALSSYDATPRLQELSGLPTFVVSAKEDPIATPAMGRALSEGITGSRYVELIDAAHGVVVEKAPQINELLLHHIQSHQ